MPGLQARPRPSAPAQTQALTVQPMNANVFRKRQLATRLPPMSGMTAEDRDAARQRFYFSDKFPLDGSATSAQFQAWLLECNLMAYTATDNGLDDQVKQAYVVCVVPRCYIAISTKAVVVPEMVRLESQAKFVRKGSTFPSQYHPALIFVNKSGADCVNLHCDEDGTQAHSGSGIAVGKNWRLSATIAPTLIGAGTKHAVNDIVTFGNPSKAPFFGFAIKVLSVDANGAILTWSVYSRGAYALPPDMQATQWVAANGINVFGASPLQYVQASTTGIGAGVILDTTNAWAGDFDTPGYYDTGAAIVTDICLGRVRLTGGRQIGYSATYGVCAGMHVGSLNTEIDSFSPIGFGCGLSARSASDVRIRIFNPVVCIIPYQFFASGSVQVMLAVLDSCGCAGIIDQCQGVQMKGRAFYADLNLPANGGPGPLPGNNGAAALLIGQYSSGNPCFDLDIDLTLQNMGSAAGLPALAIANTDESTINLKVKNRDQGYGTNAPNPISSMVLFGAGVGNNVAIKGQFGGGATGAYATAALLAAVVGQTIPGCDIDIADATMPGRVGPRGVCRISNANAPTATTGQGKAQPGSTCIDGSTGLEYINEGTAAAPYWVPHGQPSSSVAPQAGRLIGPQVSKFGTVGALGSAGNQPISVLPVYVPKPTSVAALVCEITTAASAAFSARMGIYQDNAGVPGALIVDAGTMAVAANASGYQIQALAAALVLQPGLYWVALQTSYLSPAASLRATQQGTMGKLATDLGATYAQGGSYAEPTGYLVNGGFGALPATMTGQTLSLNTAFGTPVAWLGT